MTQQNDQAESEREKFETWLWAQEWARDHHFHRRDMKGSPRFGQYVASEIQMGWEAWQGRASLSALPAGGEPVAWMWQHEETGRVGFTDPWQVENGWQKANPRHKLIRPIYLSPTPEQAAPDAGGKEDQQ